MARDNVGWREEMMVKIEGGVADHHEVDAETLGNSLLGIKQLAERTNTTINGKDCLISVKIKGGFVEGSFEYKLVLDFFGSILPVVPQVVETIKQVIQLKSFLAGESPVKIEREPGSQVSSIENNNGNIAVFQNTTIMIADTSTATRALKRFFSPFESGANRVEVSGGQDLKSIASVDEEEKNFFLNPPSDVYDVIDKEKVLEVLTAQMDGKADGWRFFDVEDETIFSAGVADQAFLSAVNAGKYGFLRGRHASATIRITRQKIDARMRTTRTIISVVPLTDKQEIEMFGSI